jgi:hypothetical protein
VERREGTGGATGVFSAGPRATPPVSQEPTGPSDYTRMFNAPRVAVAPDPTPPPAAPPVPAKASGPSILVFVTIGVLAVLAIALVLFILLKH